MKTPTTLWGQISFFNFQHAIIFYSIMYSVRYGSKNWLNNYPYPTTYRQHIQKHSLKGYFFWNTSKEYIKIGKVTRLPVQSTLNLPILSNFGITSTVERNSSTACMDCMMNIPTLTKWILCGTLNLQNVKSVKCKSKHSFQEFKQATSSTKKCPFLFDRRWWSTCQDKRSNSLGIIFQWAILCIPISHRGQRFGGSKLHSHGGAQRLDGVTCNITFNV